MQRREDTHIVLQVRCGFLGEPETFSGGSRGQNYFHNNAKRLPFTVLVFARMSQKQWLVNVLEP